VYFTRPGDSVVLRALADESPLISAAVSRAPDPTKFDTGVTSLEWLTRRIKNQRINNYKVTFFFGNASCPPIDVCRELRRGWPVEGLSTQKLGRRCSHVRKFLRSIEQVRMHRGLDRGAVTDFRTLQK
jgi:hypothetical protein